jgi:hypothetical protein
LTSYYILVRSATYAAKVSRTLSAEGYKTKCVKSPAILNSGGCGHAVVTKDENISRIIELIADAGMPEFKIYMTPDGKSFKEVYRF